MTALARHRGTLLIIAAAVAAVALAVVAGGGAGSGLDHDPDNPGARGAQAVARVLADRGVDVRVVRSAEALEEEELTGSTVLVTTPERLGRSTARRLLDEADGARVVVAGARPGTTRALGIRRQLPVAGDADDPVPADCTGSWPALPADLELAVDTALAYPTAVGCFDAGEGWLLADAGGGVTLLGAAGILENDQVLRADNAAVALRLLGSTDRLVWYVPDLADQVAGDAVSLRSLLPAWLEPAIWLLGLTMVAVTWWRGRRLGPLATEPLPVAVRAVETTQARGRLYHRARDRAHAAAALRRASLRRTTERLGLDAAEADRLVAEVARRTGRPVAEVERLLGPAAPAPATDAELIRLARELAGLDREVRRT